MPESRSAATGAPRRSRKGGLLVLIVALLLGGLGTGGYLLYELGVRRMQAEYARQEAERQAEQARQEAEHNTQRLTELLPVILRTLQEARDVVPPAANNVAAGQARADQTPLCRYVDDLRKHLGEMLGLLVALPADKVAQVFSTLPSESLLLRQKLAALCGPPALPPDSLTDERILSLLDWKPQLTRAAAEQQRKRDEAKLKLKEKYNINEREYNKQIVSAYGNLELMELLITAGADVNAADSSGRTALYSAASKDCTEVVKLLLAAPGIDVNKVAKYDDSPLFWAAGNGRTEVVKLLLAAPGIDVNKADKDGWTPLYISTFMGRTEVVKLLLATPGIDVRKVNKYGTTPLMEAIEQKHHECEELLRAAGWY